MQHNCGIAAKKTQNTSVKHLQTTLPSTVWAFSWFRYQSILRDLYTQILYGTSHVCLLIYASNSSNYGKMYRSFNEQQRAVQLVHIDCLRQAGITISPFQLFPNRHIAVEGKDCPPPFLRKMSRYSSPKETFCLSPSIVSKCGLQTTIFMLWGCMADCPPGTKVYKPLK